SRRRAIGLAADRGAAGERAIDAVDFAESAALDHLDDTPVGGAVVVDMVAHLGDAIVLARGGDHGAAFADRVGERLLDEDVLAGAAGGDGGQGVPVVGRGDHDGVDIFDIEQLAEIVEFGGRLPLRFGYDIGGAIDVGAVNVADGGGSNVRLFEKLVEARRALPADPEEAHAGAVAGRGWGGAHRRGVDGGTAGEGGTY